MKMMGLEGLVYMVNTTKRECNSLIVLIRLKNSLFFD
jgi:hypothetical protein